ncbi:MAG: protein-L-isoaspartate(D-aspartate) O-methyltransferase [bacterium]
MSEEFYTRRREAMVERQIKRRGIRDAAILEAMRQVPREAFVLDEYREAAYDDTPLPIPADQTISQPYVVALMIRALQLQPEEKVLEVGSGSGYAAAILSRIVAEVHAIERHLELVQYARTRLQELGYDNVHVHHGDGTRGWPAAAPYDAIMVSASGPRVPHTLEEQLAIGGRLVMPIGRSRGLQSLIRLTRLGEDDYREKDLGGVRFVPLIGEEGW